MPKTTVDRVRNTVKEATRLSEETLSMYIDDAFLDVQEAGFPESQQERASRYLAAHLVVLADRHIVGETVGPLKRTYSGINRDFQDLKTSPFGQEYLRLLDKYTRNNGLKLVVV